MSRCLPLKSDWDRLAATMPQLGRATTRTTASGSRQAVASGGHSQSDGRTPKQQEAYRAASKDLLIIPIHCHGNHWTLAVINIKLKRFEYYDSLRGGPLMVLENLRQWLQVRPSWRWHL